MKKVCWATLLQSEDMPGYEEEIPVLLPHIALLELDPVWAQCKF